MNEKFNACKIKLPRLNCTRFIALDRIGILLLQKSRYGEGWRLSGPVGRLYWHLTGIDEQCQEDTVSVSTSGTSYLHKLLNCMKVETSFRLKYYGRNRRQLFKSPSQHLLRTDWKIITDIT